VHHGAALRFFGAHESYFKEENMRKMLHVLTVLSALILGAQGLNAATLNVGLVISTTGKYAFVGVPLKEGIEMALAERQAAGDFGSDQVKLLFEDNGSDKDQAINLINKMGIDPNILMTIGPIATSEAMATGPVAVDRKMVIFSTATSPKVLEAGPWIYKVTEIADSYMTAMAKYAVDTLKVKKCFSLVIRDNEGYILQKQVFVDYLKNNGVEVVADESVLSSDTDFTAIATKIVDSEPDCLFLSNPPEQGANIVIQARQAGLPGDITIIGNTGMASVNYIKAGGSAIEGTYMPSDFVPTGVNQSSQDFISNYQARYGKDAKSWAAVGYTMGLVTAEAIRKASPNPTREKIRQAFMQVSNLNVPLGSGKFSIDSERIPHYGAAVVKVANGEIVLAD
jgi:branched-chain amino acid transport system substrate-binding protein